MTAGLLSAEGVVGLAVALGCGLLVGLERERRKGSGPQREAAGIRTFAVVALTGALAQVLEVTGLVVAGALLVAALTALAYARSRSRDPGLTTEIALFATYLIGVQAPGQPALAAACGVALAVLLAARDRLHRLATVLLSEQELHDGLLLAALVLIALPLLPAGPQPWAAGLDIHRLLVLLVLILGVQAAGHVALRAFGARGGLPLAGFLSGFVSSTATVATLGRRARAEPALLGPFAAAAGLSGTATWVLAGLICAASAPQATPALLPMLAAGAVVPLAAAAWALRVPAATPPAQVLPPSARPLRPREALTVAALLAGVSAAVSLAQQGFGPAGLWSGAALAALGDAHAAVAALATLAGQDRLAAPDLALGVLVAIGVNTVMRVGVAQVAGGTAYALRVAVGLVPSLAVAGAVAAGSGALPA
jgi:uncharacterized membrane protein (DUF4010 family)